MAPTTSGVRIESPFPVAAWPRVWSWISDFRTRVSDDFGPQTLRDFVARQLAANSQIRTWAVYRGEELCGMVSFEPANPIAGTSHTLFRKDFWGRGTTRDALRQVYSEIFASGVHKIEGEPFRDNHAMIALATSLGFKKEGLRREHTMRGGQLVDMVILGLTKGDFEKCLS